ncbi:MAG: hypothetical protein ACLQDM_21940 [Bradyrhizobium sp.]
MLHAMIMIAHAVVGWGLCGATIGIGRKVTTLRNSLVAHAIAAPVIFAVVSTVYFHWFGGTGPTATAAAFVATVIFLDVFVVAVLVEKSFDMFRSVLGTWLPFALIFLATWLTGWAVAAP